MDSVIKGLISSCLIGFLVACSLEPLSENRKIWLSIDGETQVDGRSPQGLMSASPAPSSLGNFDCLGVNVSGPGIADTSTNPEPNLGTIFDRLLRKESYCSYRGILVGPLSSNFAQPQEVALVVPPGLRLIQLIGVKEVNGSNSCQAEFNPAIPQNVDPSGRPLEGDFYEVGRAVADLFSDQAITILPEWSALTASERTVRQVNCGALKASPTPSPSVVIIRAPTTVSGAGTVASVAMGNHICFAASGSGNVSCKGSNATGELGNGTTSSYSPSFVSTGVTGATEVGVGNALSCARIGTAGVQCWGLNSSGQVGNATTTSTFSPVSVTSLTGTISQLTVGNSHACVVTDLPSPGTLRCWGSNSSGEIGDATTMNRMIPIQVTGGISASQVSAGAASTCAVLTDGTARCWGSNGAGQLGNGTQVNSFMPVAVSGLSGVLEVSVGGSHACALLSDTTVKCWGNNSSGQLGDGTVTNRLTPVSVSGLSGITSIKAGNTHTCSFASGSIKCWGSNSMGQLGDGASANASLPGVISGSVAGITAISGMSSGFGTCMVASTNVLCWGSNHNAQIIPLL